MTPAPEQDVAALVARRPIIDSFAINPVGEGDIEVEGSGRFAHERDVARLHDWAKEAATALSTLAAERDTASGAREAHAKCAAALIEASEARATALEAERDELQKALRDISLHAENADFSHLEFRIKARECADDALRPRQPSLCDCERGHNGLGMAGRECDCGVDPAAYWQGVAERALAKQHAMSGFEAAVKWLEDEPEYWDTPREFRDMVAKARTAS